MKVYFVKKVFRNRYKKTVNWKENVRGSTCLFLDGRGFVRVSLHWTEILLTPASFVKALCLNWHVKRTVSSIILCPSLDNSRGTCSGTSKQSYYIGVVQLSRVSLMLSFGGWYWWILNIKNVSLHLWFYSA